MVVSVCAYINEVAFWDKSLSKDEALEELFQIAAESGYLLDKEKFKEELWERERVMSTGIGLGVAIPHVKSNSVKAPFIILGISREKIENWESIDDQPVKFVFLVGVPTEQHRMYLQLLSRIVLKMKTPERRKNLLKASSKEDVMKILKC